MKDREVVIVYTNHRGDTEERRITPLTTWFGSTDWHPQEQWLLYAYCHDRQAHRNFALAGVKEWRR